MTRLLDLFCGAGGCTKGYQMAGFEVYGVDINPMPRYCGHAFIQEDAIATLDWLIGGVHPEWTLEMFDAIHASPPCQRFSTATPEENREKHPDLVAPVRQRLRETGLPYIIENVVGAPLENPVLLCGGAFGLVPPRLCDSEGGMSTPQSCRLDRYRAAGLLAGEILAQAAGQDEFLIEQAIQDLRDQVDAGRRNQADWPLIQARVLRMLNSDWSVRADLLEKPRHLHVVGDEL